MPLMGVGSRLSPQSWLEGAAGLSPSICRVLSMSSTAAEAGDAGEHPQKHAVCRGGAALGQRQRQEGGKY